MSSNKKKKKIARSAPFDIYIFLTATGERFLLKRVYAEMKIRELKCYTELVAGIPSNLQRLQYLDEGDMLDDSDLRHNDVVAGASINLKLWRTWEELVAAVCKGWTESVFKQDIVISKEWERLDPLLYRNKVAVCSDRAAVALFIAAHRGYVHLIRSLIDDAHANVNMKTPFGRSPLHASASQGHSSSIDVMLEKGAAMDEADVQGKTPLMVASQCGFKDSERHLFLFQWQTRAAQIRPRTKSTALMMHQQFDSEYPIWLKGKHAQVYFCQTLPPGEFAGTGLSAPRRKPKVEKEMTRRDDFELPPIAEAHGGSPVFSGTQIGRFHATRRLLSSKSHASIGSSRSSTFDDWLQAKNEKKAREQQREKEKQARKEMEKEMKMMKIGKSFEDWKQSKQQKLLPIQTKKDVSLYRQDNEENNVMFEMTFQQWLRKNADGDVYS